MQACLCCLLLLTLFGAPPCTLLSCDFTTMPDTTTPEPPSEPPPEETNVNNNTEDLPPLRLHATRVPERLSSSSSLPTTPSNTPSTNKHQKHVRRRSLDRKNSNPRSRSKSPSLKDTATTMDGGSSLSSLEDFVDSDILTDSKGMMELDSKEQEAKTHQLHLSSSSLPPVHERMSEETLDDVHAFSDIKTPSTLSSRGNSTVGTAGDVGSYLLETLDECEEEDQIVEKGEVIFTNMENLTIHENEEAEGDTSLELSSAMAKTV